MFGHKKRLLAAFAVAFGTVSGPAEAPLAPIALAFPLACRLGESCAIQNYVDADPSPGAKDYQCGSRSYQAHDGTDFRLRSMAQARAGVAVLAAADGTVLRARDGVPDRSVRDANPGSVEGRECGNGVVVGHPGGWETQYCHMAQGSIAVRPGQAVRAGTALGRVGLSGNTEYPHLHLTVRQGGEAIDPFAYGAPAGSCGRGRSLWRASAGLAGSYRAGEVLNAGFAAGPVSMADAQEGGSQPLPRPGRAAPALVAFVQAIGLRGGDVQRLSVKMPDGSVLAETVAAPLDRDKAQTILFAGRKRRPGDWAAGVYRAVYTVKRGGSVVVEKAFSVRL